MNRDEHFMRFALALAVDAAKRGDVPVGAVIVKDGAVISGGFNEKSTDPTAHAEMRAIREACAAVGSWNLSESELYVSLEPCPMCAGAIVLSRIKRVVFGCTDPKAGAAGTLYDILRDTRLNHRCSVKKGVLEHESRELLVKFFKERRDKQCSFRTGING